MKKLAAAFFLCLIVGINSAWAQSVTSVGSVTPGHFAIYNSPTVIKDGGYGPSDIIDAPGFDATTLGSVSAVAYGFNSAKTGFYSGSQDASVGLSINGSDVLDYGITTAATLTAKTAFAIADGGSWTGTISGTPTLSGANFITLGNLVQDATAYSLLGNATSGTANYAPFTIGALSLKASPGMTDKVLLQDASTGALDYTTVSALTTAGSVASINSLTGAITLAHNGGAKVTSAGTTVTVGDPGGYLNKFRNGTFDIWQRGTTATSIGTTGSYFADGWKVYFTGSTSVTALQAAGPGSGLPLYSLEIEGATSNTDIKAGQRIESYVAAPLAGQTVTVQFWYYQNTGSTVTPKFSTCYASAQDNFGTCTGDVSSTGLTACATATWCQEAYTFTASSSAGNGYEIDLDCNAGFTSISVNCRFAAADVRVTPGVSTGVNTNPPPPELRPIATELAFCERYFAVSHYSPTIDTVNLDFLGTAYSAGYFGNWRLPVTQRAAPTFTLTTGSWANNTPTIVTGIDVIWFFASGGAFYASGSGAGAISGTASSEL